MDDDRTAMIDLQDLEAFARGAGWHAFQNENLIAAPDGSPVATTPSLIMVLSDVTGETVTTNALRYGQRVRVVAAPCDARWHTNGGIAFADPRRFGYDMDPISPSGFVS